MHSFTSYVKAARIKEAQNITDGKKAVKEVLSSFEVLLTIERRLLELSAKAGDEGTNSMMSDYIRQQEKLVWMYSASLK
jgi:starvation-inducible DNA-binding protein